MMKTLRRFFVLFVIAVAFGALMSLSVVIDEFTVNEVALGQLRVAPPELVLEID